VCRIVHTPSVAVELSCALLFARYPPGPCIEYDWLFRQATARDRSVCWDIPKEDNYVWALTQTTSLGLGSHAFRDHSRIPISMRLGPLPKSAYPSGSRVTHTSSGKEICKRLNLTKCTKGDECILICHVCWHRHCLGNHPGKGCPKQDWAPASSHPITTLSIREGASYSPSPQQILHIMHTHGTPWWGGHRIHGTSQSPESEESSIRSIAPTRYRQRTSQERSAGRVLGPFTHQPYIRTSTGSGVWCGSGTPKTRQVVYDNAPISPSQL
jgi:hypothetical protein